MTLTLTDIVLYLAISVALLGLAATVFGAVRSKAFEQFHAPSSDIKYEDNGGGDLPRMLLREYHVMGLAQSRISFWFSLIFAAVGFLVIIISALTARDASNSGLQSKSAYSLIGGIVISAFSHLLLVQSNKAREVMVNFFEKFRSDKRRDDAIRLSTEIADDMLQSKLRAILALHFADVGAQEHILSSAFGNSDNERSEKKTKGATAE